ncbi:hypothetical protein FRC11_006719 [Ceratobasidium sp. 423]|nr:hypothetical protein FRC11_006719 [Ceratobasidium sp. 423]
MVTRLWYRSLAQPSLCTITNIRDYFLDGKVPANGTRCDPEPGYIYPTNNTNSKRSVSKGDKELLRVLNKLGGARSKLAQRRF